MISIPTECPKCSCELELVKDQLYCRNADCSINKRIEKFCKAVKIKGLGPQTIEKLELNSIEELFYLTQDELVSILGVKIGEKLFTEIEEAKIRTTISEFLAGQSIPLIGETASRKVAKLISKIDELSYEVCKTAGLGDKATNNLMSWISSKPELPFEPKSEQEAQITTKDLGLKVCITGKVPGFSRTELKDYLFNFGVTLVDSVTSKTSYLVCDAESTSSKYTKAKQLNIPVVTFEQFNQLIIGK
jgi:DNA ligase (NAD+)